MHNFSLRFSMVSLALMAAAAPAIAGNYAEGDPRPAAFSSQRSAASVGEEARAFTKTAPGGYPEGNPRAVTRVEQKSRAEVRADTMNWVRSGLAGMQDGEMGLDETHPLYREAQQRYSSATVAGSTATAPDGERRSFSR